MTPVKLIDQVAGGIESARLDPTSRLKLNRLEKRWANCQYREAYSPDNLKKTFQSILKQIQNKRDKAITVAQNLRRKPPLAYLAALDRVRRKVSRRHASLLKVSQSVATTRSRLFKGLSTEEMNERLGQLLRVPLHEFRGFNKLSGDEQELRFNALLAEYGQGSQNGGFAPALLNMSDVYHDSYMLGSGYETDGSKRRPQFIHEIIERFIAAALEPTKFKQIFFVKTAKEVKKWGHNWRQIRSEGRFAMVKVMIVLLPYLDFRASLRMGIRNHKTGEYSGLSCGEIAKRAGISEDSVDSALRNLENQGLLHPGKQGREFGEKFGGAVGWSGLTVVRCMTSNFIVRLGLGERFCNERKATSAAGLPAELKTVLDDLDYAKLHPEQFTMKEVAFMSMAADLFGTPSSAEAAKNA